MALRPPFSFQQAQYVQVFPLKPRPFCKHFAGLDSTNKSAISFLFSFSLTLALFLPLCLLCLSFYLNLSGKSGRNCLLFPSVLSGYDRSADTRFSRATTQLISRSNGERYSCPLKSLVISLLLSLVSTLIFPQTGGVLSHLNSSGSLGFH